MSAQKLLETDVADVFGPDAKCEGPLAESGLGVRLSGIDLSQPLRPAQVTFLLDTLSRARLMCIAGQDLAQFSLNHFERFANHWGAPIPHPSNYLRGGKPAQQNGATGGEIEYLPYEARKTAAANATLPEELACLPHESPAVLIASNLLGRVQSNTPTLKPGGSWHTDVEYEPLPIYVSMFLAHHTPTARSAHGGTWVNAPTDESAHPYFEDSDPELLALRTQLPLNGETCYADTAAAFAALPPERQAALEQVRVRRRLNDEDEGWLAPLVRTDPRSGIKSLHSPVWASRPRIRPTIEVDGMDAEASRAFLDEIEKHVLLPQFRYNHLHKPGDVTIWNNYMTLHNSPPILTDINSVDDARLLYRLSCKGAPALSLPREDDPSWLASHVVGAYKTPPEILELAATMGK